MIIDKYIKEIYTINKELSAAEYVIDESIFTFAFLQGLLPKYMPFIARLTTRPKDSSLKDTIAQIKAHETILAFKDKAQSQPYFPP